MRRRTSGSASGWLQGSVALPSSFHEWMLKRGWVMPASIQRSSSSASGAGPAKPPTSWPWFAQPDSDIDRPIGRLNASVFQLVRLSPDQVWA
jgi:hypothetical protein